MSDIIAVKRALNDRVDAVCEALFPNGRRMGHEWRVGSLSGEPGDSLGVHLTGHKVGVWKDFATGEDGGDLIDLWCKVKGLDLPDALKEIKGWLGLPDEPVRFEGAKQKKTWARPKRRRSWRTPRGVVRDYLMEERNLSAAAIEAYKVIEDDRHRSVIFPFLRDGEFIFCKYRDIDPDARGRKVTGITEKDLQPILFGWQAIPENTREVVITEGEIDALSMWDYGHPALSVPQGAGKGSKHAWIEHEYHHLERFERIYLVMDRDEEGRIAVADLVDRLGRHRCYVVELPRKDVNECLQDGVAKEEIDRCLAAARTVDPAELRSAKEFCAEVIDLFHPPGGEPPGYKLPWPDYHDKVRFRRGEMTIWQGATSAGKSQLLSHALVDMMAQGARVCIASLEMAPRMQLKRMTQQVGGTNRPTPAFIVAIHEWYDDKCWIFNMVGKSGIDRLLEVFDYARARYGVDTFVVDSLMRIGGIATDDYAKQEEAVFKLVSFAVQHEVHVHLVAHSRKGGGMESVVPDNEDVKGTSEIASNAFNIFGVWRNRRVEEEQAEALRRFEKGEIDRDALEEALTKPAVILNVSKQRNGDWEGKISLHFSKESYQYQPRRMRYQRQYLSLGEVS